MKNIYNLRNKCVFCESDLESCMFDSDSENYSGHYPVSLDSNLSEMHLIPFNVCACPKCHTVQNRYLGDIEEVYSINHADSTGKIMAGLHEMNLEFICGHSESIKGIIEVGSSKGILADKIIESIGADYYIIEPSYFGSVENKTIINDFYENVDDSSIEANTIVMSHVFEHFYEPGKILDKIRCNRNIENFFLVFPDLEHYAENGIYHILNTEHTFYIDNDFLESLMESHGFRTVERKSYVGHSVLFYFKRDSDVKSPEISFRNRIEPIKRYFEDIRNTVEIFKEAVSNSGERNVYIWPASVHSLYLSNFGFDLDSLTGFLDNSKLKIGKKMYGTSLQVFDFEEVASRNDGSIILVNGGVFNSEISEKLKGTEFVFGYVSKETI